MSNSHEAIQLSRFAKCVGQDFMIRASGETARLKLVEATALPPATQREDLPIRKEPFSLIFRLAGDGSLEQGTYQVAHESTGITEMFVVPVGFGEYQVIFN